MHKNIHLEHQTSKRFREKPKKKKNAKYKVTLSFMSNIRINENITELDVDTKEYWSLRGEKTDESCDSAHNVHRFFHQKKRPRNR